MPTADGILAGLTAITNDAFLAAVFWHVVLAVVIGAVAIGWRPSRRKAAASIAALLVSVSAFAFGFGNPFNGFIFAVGAVALLMLAMTLDTQPVGHGPSWAWCIGVAMIAFGWVYPHFLTGQPALFLIAAPIGLVPCPTLAVAIGVALLAGGLGSRPWRLVLAGLGILYGLFGALRLGVALDFGLLVGALALGATALLPTRLPTGLLARI